MAIKESFPIQIIDRNQLCEVFGLSLQSIDRLERSSDLPFIKIGITHYYRPQDIEKFFENRKQRQDMKTLHKAEKRKAKIEQEKKTD